MRVNIYAEEMTDRLEIISKEIDGRTFTGLRIYLELPATVDGKQYQGPFMHRPGDDDSAAVTFWGKRDLRDLVDKMRRLLDDHYTNRNIRRLTSWVPMAERTPTERGDYFVFCSTGNRTILAWNGHRWLETLDSVSGDPDYWNRFVTHWQPLPAAPAQSDR